MFAILETNKGLNSLIRKEKQETIICNPVKNQFNRKMGTEKNKEFTRNYYILMKNALLIIKEVLFFILRISLTKTSTKVY